MADKYIIVLVTCASRREAENISDKLLEKRLIACSNIAGNIESKFRWKGKVCKVRECLMFLKALNSDFRQIEKTVKSLHSYEVPEIVSIPIFRGSRDYLKWVDMSCKKS